MQYKMWEKFAKEWEGDSDNLFETRPSAGIKLQLWRINPDGSREVVGSPVAINADSMGYRPVISLLSLNRIIDGSGSETDPWVIE